MRVFANKYSEQYLSAYFIITIHNVSVPQDLHEEYSTRHSAQNRDTMGSHIVMIKLCALKDCPDYYSIMVTFCHDLNIGESAVVLWNKTKVL